MLRLDTVFTLLNFDLTTHTQSLLLLLIISYPSAPISKSPSMLTAFPDFKTLHIPMPDSQLTSSLLATTSRLACSTSMQHEEQFSLDLAHRLVEEEEKRHLSSLSIHRQEIPLNKRDYSFGSPSNPSCISFMENPAVRKTRTPTRSFREKLFSLSLAVDSLNVSGLLSNSSDSRRRIPCRRILHSLLRVAKEGGRGSGQTELERSEGSKNGYRSERRSKTSRE